MNKLLLSLLSLIILTSTPSCWKKNTKQTKTTKKDKTKTKIALQDVAVEEEKTISLAKF